jgi:hypothetical protein
MRILTRVLYCKTTISFDDREYQAKEFEDFKEAFIF